MALLKFLPIQVKRLGRFAPRARVPAVRQDDPADVPKQRRDFRQRAGTPLSRASHSHRCEAFVAPQSLACAAILLFRQLDSYCPAMSRTMNFASLAVSSKMYCLRGTTMANDA